MPTLDEDIDAIMGDTLFGTCAEFVLDADADENLCVDGIFTEPSDATVMYGVEIEAVKPTFMAKTSAITRLTTKMTVAIDGSDYIVEKIEKAGTGISTCYLKTKQG